MSESVGEQDMSINNEQPPSGQSAAPLDGEDRLALRAAAEKLPRVKWTKTRSTVCIPETEDAAGKDLPINGLDKQYARHLATYIAAANPSTILSLLDEIDALRSKPSAAPAAPQAVDAANPTAEGMAALGDELVPRVIERMEREEREACEKAVLEHLGPAALTGGKMSVYDAFHLGWQARAALAVPAASPPAAKAAPAVPQWPRVFGVSRDMHPRCLVISLAAEPTDDQVRAIHAALTTQGESRT